MPAQMLQDHLDRKMARGRAEGVARGRVEGVAAERMQTLLEVAADYLSAAGLASCRTALATRTVDQMPPVVELLQVARTAEHPGQAVADLLRHPWPPSA